MTLQRQLDQKSSILQQYKGTLCFYLGMVHGLQPRQAVNEMCNLEITINIPALDRLVDFLTSQGDQQKQIDSLTTQVTTLTETLNQSSTKLSSAVETSKI